MTFYTNYIKYNKNYWERKLIDDPKNFNVNLIKSSNLTIEQSKELFKKYVEIVNLETSAYCNRVCPYCPVAVYGRKDKTIQMSESMLSSVIVALKQIAVTDEPFSNAISYAYDANSNESFLNSPLYVSANINIPI